MGVSMRNVNTGAASTAMAVSSAPTRRVCFCATGPCSDTNDGKKAVGRRVGKDRFIEVTCKGIKEGSRTNMVAVLR